MTVALPDAVPHRLTGRRVVVDEPLRLGAGGRPAAVAVQFLRECQSHDLSAHWVPDADDALSTRPADAAFDIRTLHHLPAPTTLPGEPPELADWRSEHAYGQLYHRRGPDFVTVMDRRDRAASARFTLDHPDLHAAFLVIQEATALDDLSAVHREAVSLLTAERLALVTGGWVVALPPRIRHWPVPCTGI